MGGLDDLASDEMKKLALKMQHVRPDQRMYDK